jgi:hypothetical protein
MIFDFSTIRTIVHALPYIGAAVLALLYVYVRAENSRE